jgi:hypothetical protein
LWLDLRQAKLKSVFLLMATASELLLIVPSSLFASGTRKVYSEVYTLEYLVKGLDALPVSSRETWGKVVVRVKDGESRKNGEALK